MKSTGVTSTSFRVWLATFIPSLAGAVTAFSTNADGSKSAALGAASIVSAVVSTVAKLAHDHGLNKAQIAAAGSEFAAQLPQLKLDIQKTISFIENDVPGLRGVISSVDSHASAVETRVNDLASKIPDLAGIEQVVRTVLGQVLAAPVAVAPLAQVPPPAP